ncbi:MAG TPA: SMP-30/gluconolactonase/LRE family protein [Solirubrobacteraceae bacterium]|nr:SMP-30/gluconolactonase/LRE family protein [Solirubrobacteraceae bacterium]
MRAERLTDAVAEHAEGPVWSQGWGGLRWVDMHAGDVLSLAPDGGVGRRHVGAVAAALRPRSRGGAVIAVERGFVLEDGDGGLTALGELWPAAVRLRMNEGGCDPDGRFYCGSMHYDQEPGAAALHRLEPGGTVVTVLGGLTISNGLDWSPDGTLAYYVDTATNRVDVFDYAGGELRARRPFARVPREAGHPDGLAVDAEGGVWVALYDGGAVRRYGPGGELDAVVEVGARKVTACAFGGDGLRELFITTSREGLAAGEDPAAGSLFRAMPAVSGRPVREFAG